ncbi:MAG: hypothetical protein Q9160_002374 [Pyrenula sp. 1 TL-2023]
MEKMTSTRHQPPVRIFCDEDSLNASISQRRPTPRLQPSAMPLQPVNNIASNFNVVLDPPSTGSYPPSPSKPAPFLSSQAALPAGFNFVSIPPPPDFPHFNDSPVKKPSFSSAHQVYHAVPQKPMFTTFHSVPADYEDKENTRNAKIPIETFAEFPEPSSYGRKQSVKRPLMDAAPMNERPTKKARVDDAPTTLPEPHEMPHVEDDGEKPPYSYAQLIGMAILRASHRRLTLAQIYNWISTTFAFYKEAEGGWQNSIRHNLSLNKAFEKTPKPKEDPGKGNYWAIKPGMEMQFLKDRPLRNRGTMSMSIPGQVMKQDLTQPFIESLPQEPWPMPPAPEQNEQPIPALQELSSDATLPASDPALNEEQNDPDHSSFGQPSSSPAINSSPPFQPSHRRRATSPGPGVPHTSSGPRRLRERKIDMFDDSGYFSSLESSALKGSKHGAPLMSEQGQDNRRVKRGRAEEEIARIRSSSHDISPHHARSSRLGSMDIQSSSPIRPTNNTSMLPPATPGKIFRKPTKPPPSVSPNTNLRNHRKRVQALVNSPIKNSGLLDEDIASTWSPSFNLDENTYNDPFTSHFDIFADHPFEMPTAVPTIGSPLKQPIKRPASAQPTQFNVLNDVTRLSHNKNNSKTPLRNQLFLKPKLYADSPSKSPSKMFPPLPNLDQEDIFNFDSFPDDFSDCGDGFDVLQGFQKIGGPLPSNPPKISSGNRPALGNRSWTTQF